VHLRSLPFLAWALLCLGMWFAHLPLAAEALRARWFWSLVPPVPVQALGAALLHLRSLGFVAVAAAAGLGTGLPLLALARFRGGGGTAVALASGLLGVVPLGMLGLGLAGLLHPPLVAAVLAVAAIWGVLAVRRLPRERLARPRPLVIFAMLLLLPSLISSLAPETEYDALRYHLALPLRYLAHHRVFLAGPHPFSGFPLSGEMLLAAGLCFGGRDPATACLPGKLLNWSLLPFTLFLVAASAGAGSPGGSKRTDRDAPYSSGTALPWLMLAASPLLSRLAGNSFTDLCAAAAFAGALRATAPRATPGRAFTAGFLLGAAGAAKFSAASLAPFVLPFLVPAGTRVVAFAALAAMMVPTVARNFLLTGSPHGGVFWAGFMPSFMQADETLNPAAAARWVGWGDPSQWLWLPRYLLVDARAAGHELSPAFAALLPVLFLVRGPARAAAMASISSLAVWAVVGGGQVRYLVPALPVIAIACSAGIRAAPAWITRGALSTVLLAGALALPGTCAHFANSASPLSVVAGSELPRQYLSRALTPRSLYMAVGAWLGERPEAGRPYIAGDIKAAYWPRDPLVDSEYLAPFLFNAARDSADERRIRIRFRQARIGCLVHRAEGTLTFQQMVGGGYRWDDRALFTLQRFLGRYLERAASFERRADNAYYDIHMVASEPRPLSPPRVVPYAEALTLEGDAAFNRGRFRDAREAWAAVARRFPRFALPLARMADADDRLGRRTEAARERASAARLFGGTPR